MLFHYDDHNPKREVNHAKLRDIFRATAEVTELSFRERDAVASFRANGEPLKALLTKYRMSSVVFDMTVFTKRHLLMMLNWLDDFGCWDRLNIVYTEPQDYDATAYLPLSFGIAGFEQIPGFAGTPDSSRPLHLLIFLGYEGERALATYEQLQPIKTTLVVPHPPFREEWAGRTEEFNKDLITRVGSRSVVVADSVDPEKVCASIRGAFGSDDGRSEYAKILCPLGTKPQALGAYLYVRRAADPPALIYSGPLRHNERFYSHGIGPSWLLQRQA
ncbi:MAG: hypothetical protein HYY78_14325 [Betaproteobacteria bacterium]|nr:hypothetical protein [Betaproteobacteria bacterium]